jgi:hypothetical protein
MKRAPPTGGQLLKYKCECLGQPAAVPAVDRPGVFGESILGAGGGGCFRPRTALAGLAGHGESAPVATKARVPRRSRHRCRRVSVHCSDVFKGRPGSHKNSIIGPRARKKIYFSIVSLQILWSQKRKHISEATTANSMGSNVLLLEYIFLKPAREYHWFIAVVVPFLRIDQFRLQEHFEYHTKLYKSVGVGSSAKRKAPESKP